MPIDQHGLELTGSAEAVEHYDRAIHELLHFREGVIDEARSAYQADPTFPMGNALRAYLRLLSSEPDDAAAAREPFERFRASVPADRLLPRERGHVDAVAAWLDGDMRGAGQILAEVTRTHPRDALALAVAHQIDFFTGDALMLRDRIGSALPAWSEQDDPHYGPMLGMYAFGLEEQGEYDRSEDTGLHAVDLDGKDVWGIHAVVHTYEMQARFAEGIRYYDARRDDWSKGNFFTVHNWWHYCLYRLEAGDVGRALEIYDAAIHNADSAGAALEMLDAGALLWRLYLDGIDQTERWSALADAWAARNDPPFYSFNDAHAVMSYVGAGRFATAEELIADRERYVAEPHPGVTNHAMTARVGLPVCKAIVAFGKSRYGQAVDLLYPIRTYVNEFGGSHAQRDAVQRTLLEAAIRAKRYELAGSLLDERIHVKPCSPYNWLKQARLAEALGDRAAASAAEQRAQELVGASGVTPGS
ncbi:MAG TPA: tetratricopeptide repeat protein [Gaiellaceae bacterium]|nr:tetratricopeptide repeat protein [Gaiellaceae bacterium]